jgi:hypothetical protein
MREADVDFTEAIRQVRRSRPTADPNLHFCIELSAATGASLRSMRCRAAMEAFAWMRPNLRPLSDGYGSGSSSGWIAADARHPLR